MGLGSIILHRAVRVVGEGEGKGEGDGKEERVTGREMDGPERVNDILCV